MLHNCIRTEALLVVSCADRSHYTRPHTWSTSQAVEDFFQLSYEKTPDDFAGRLESYKLAGVEGMSKETGHIQHYTDNDTTGVRQSANEELLKMKAACSHIIREKLS
jgi:hypothetical protein